MYCPQCKLDIPDPQQVQCPLCNGMLIAPLKKRSQQTADGDHRLKDLIADVKKSLEGIPGEAAAGMPSHDTQPPEAEKISRDADDEAAFSIDLAQGDSPETGLSDAHGHEPEEDSLNRFDMERELNLAADKTEILSPEESAEIITVENKPAATGGTAATSDQETPQEVSPEVLQQIIDGLDKAGPQQQTRAPQRKPAFLLIVALVLGVAAISILSAPGSKDLLVNILRLVQPQQKALDQESAPVGEKQPVSSLQMPGGDDTTGEKQQATADSEHPAVTQDQQRTVTVQNEFVQPSSVPTDTAQKATAVHPAPVQQPATTELQVRAASDNTTAVQNSRQPTAQIATENGTGELQHKESLQASPVYTIHADSYRKEQSAILESAKLRKLGVAAFVQTMNLKERGLWYRVMIGKFSSHEDAQKMLHELQQTHKKTDARITILEE